MSSPSKLELFAKWLDEHQHEDGQTQAKVILVESTKNNIYKFEAAFLCFGLEGEIDLATNQISNGNLYAVAPIWGRVNLVEGIAGNLDSSIKSQFSQGPNLNGNFTLSLDKKNLVIDYNFNFKSFVGNVSNKIALSTLPDSANPSASVAAAPSVGRAKLFTMTAYTEEHELFDKFLDDHYDSNTRNIVIQSYTPGA